MRSPESASRVDQELETLIRARYPIIYVVSWEEKRVEDALRAITARRGKRIFAWTVTQGMVVSPTGSDDARASRCGAGRGRCSRTEPAVFLLKDFHAFISDVAVTRRLRDLTTALKTSYKTLVILAPILKLPLRAGKGDHGRRLCPPDRWRTWIASSRGSSSPSRGTRRSIWRSRRGGARAASGGGARPDRERGGERLRSLPGGEATLRRRRDPLREAADHPQERHCSSTTAPEARLAATSAGWTC